MINVYELKNNGFCPSVIYLKKCLRKSIRNRWKDKGPLQYPTLTPPGAPLRGGDGRRATWRKRFWLKSSRLSGVLSCVTFCVHQPTLICPLNQTISYDGLRVPDPVH